MHRPRIDWEKAELRSQHGTVEQRIFDGLKKMIAVRKTTPAFADFNNRELLESGNPHLFVFMRSNPFLMNDRVLVVANFDAAPQSIDLAELPGKGRLEYPQLRDLYSGVAPRVFNNQLAVPGFGFYWLTDHGLI